MITQVRARAAAYGWTLRERYLARYVFIHIPKTGGSSIERALGLRHEHKTALDKADEIGRERWDRRFTFVVVRNPFDRAVSHYHWRVATGKAGPVEDPRSFPDWVRATYADRDARYVLSSRMFTPQRDWVEDREGEVLVEFLARFERLEQDWTVICERIGTAVELPHDKKTVRGDYREYYDPESRSLVEAHYAADLEAFDYDF